MYFKILLHLIFLSFIINIVYSTEIKEIFLYPIITPFDPKSPKEDYVDIYYKLAATNQSYIQNMNASDVIAMVDGILDQLKICKIAEMRSLTTIIYCISLILLWVAAILTGIFLYFNSLIKNLCKISNLWKENGFEDDRSDSNEERKNQKPLYRLLPLRQVASKN